MIKLYANYLRMLCACLLLSTSSLQASTGCTGADVTFTNITLTGVGNGLISYQVTIRNVGTITLAYNKLTLSNYISDNSVYDVSDASGGSALVSTVTSGTSLAPGQELTTTYQASYTGNIKDIGYLLLQLSYQDAECDDSNNEIVACTKPDPVLNDIVFSYLDATSGLYKAYIKNKGGDTVFLDITVLQNYVSVNNMLDATDEAAGVSTLSYGEKQYLLANESYVIDFNIHQANLSNYTYVLATLYYSTGTACGAGHLVSKEMVVTVTDKEDALHLSENAMVWDMNSHSFITKKSGWANNLTYRLMDTSGRLLTTGKTIPGERVYLPVVSGFAILVISDDQQVYSQKISR